MHRFLRAAGFSGLQSEKQIYDFIRKEVLKPEFCTDVAALRDGCRLAEYRFSVSPNIGICAGVIDLGDGEGRLDYYYPYFRAEHVSSEEICSVERYTERENYAGLIDEYKIGLSLIFFVTNPVSYRKRPDRDQVMDFRGAYLSAFCNEGTVILPVLKNETDTSGREHVRKEHESLIEAARGGDEDAIETLTATDMNMYHEISKRIETEDLYSVVEQSLMPTGVECDQYAVIGEIRSIDETENAWSGEPIWELGLSCNDVSFTVAIRKADLLGEPAVGRRFKGHVWMQGEVDFSRPEPISD